MIRCVRIGPELYVCARNFRLLSLLAHEAFSGASGSRTGRFNTISGYFAGFDRLHAFTDETRKDVHGYEYHGVYLQGLKALFPEKKV